MEESFSCPEWQPQSFFYAHIENQFSFSFKYMANINIKKSIEVLRSLTSSLCPKVGLDLRVCVLMSLFTDVKNEEGNH